MMLDSNSINSLTPEQNAKFYTQNSVDKSTKKVVKKNAVLGVLVATLLIGTFVFIVIKKGGNPVINPFSDSVENLKNKDPRTVQHPLTGLMYTPEDATAWQALRPFAVMINNYFDARPQSGLNGADVVYEIVAEGGITRYLAFFLTNTPEKIGPVRSTREYYLVLVKELGDAMIMHIGWSPQALEAIETWPVRSLGRGGASFWRDQQRIDSGIAIEHTAYVNGKDLRELGTTLGWEGTREFKTWQFKDDYAYWGKGVQKDYKSATDIAIDFWYKGDYSGIFKHDPTNNEYLRYTGYDEADKPVALLDQETKEQIKVKNLIVQFVTETSISGDEKNRLTYDLVGSGKGLVFIDGKVVDVTWSKESRDARTMFYDLDGNEMSFNRGKFWISIVPDRNVEQVVY